jgi:hypothetical protein
MADLFEKPLKESIRVLEYHRLCAALFACQYNQKKAAALLGVSYDQFRGLKKKHDPDLRKADLLKGGSFKRRIFLKMIF